ncbi:MAG TPA: zf-HC2 domain-containing protein [Mycobacteriales bacterium]|nr:zf-HC2 domain-containing protein [Mycobacteriales bacterium]
MITMMRGMLTCRWAARRIQRYLDADPAALLDPAEVARLRAHLAACARCGRRVEEYARLSRALAAWSRVHAPQPQVLARVHQAAERIMTEDPG